MTALTTTTTKGTTMNNAPLTYKLALSLDRVAALTLGVPGRDQDAWGQRLAVAEAIRAEHMEIEQRAYAVAHWMNEPDIPAPFGTYALVTAGGDVQAVVDSPDFEYLVLDDMGRGHREEIVSDEDGTRWERFGPTEHDYAEARAEAAQIRAQLVAAGVIDAAARPQPEPESEPTPEQLRQLPF